MNLVSPYKDIKQHTRIAIEPFQMNSEIKNNMKANLKKKVEKKCNQNGFIDEVYRIIEYSDGMMIPENLNACAIYNITYHCKICAPIENTIVIGKVKVINSELIIATNGPLMFFIPKENIETNTWDVTENYLHKKQKKKLAFSDDIKIQILNKRVNKNDSIIKVIGKLIDFATPEEVEKYFGNKISEEKTDLESNFII